MKNKTLISALIAGLIIVMALATACGMFIGYKLAVKEQVGFSAYNTSPSFVTASSTWYTITTTSVRIAASSTPTRRQALTIQPVNCTTGTTLFLNTQADVAAVSGQGLAVYASSTLQMTDYAELPVVQGSVRAITGVGTCTVLVTEWRSQY